MVLERVKVSKYGEMEANMKVTGRMTWQMEKEDSYMRMEMFITGIGLMIKLMVKGYMNT